MRVINNSTVFPEDPIHFLDFEQFQTDKETDHITLHIDSPKNSDPFLGYNILLDLEMPNRYMEPSQRGQCFIEEQRYNKILTNCPHVSYKRNKALGKNLYKYIPVPTSKKYAFDVKKDINVVYTGNYIPYLEWLEHPAIIIGRENSKASICNCDYKQKLELTARAKIALVHTELVLRQDQIDRLLSLENHEECFELRNRTLAQQKARITEAAINKCIMLCKADSFNLILDFYKENKEVLIYHTRDELNLIISEIITNYDKYKYIGENAYNRAMSTCTTEAIYNNIIKPI